MTYIFSGILTDQEIQGHHPEDSEELVVRKIKHDQLRSGVLFANQAEEQIYRPNEATVSLIQSLKDIGLTDGLWIYYCCWGGDIECVATAKVSNSQVDMDSYSLSENMSYEDLSALFEKFDINIENSGHFEPFVRNYWGKYGY